MTIKQYGGIFGRNPTFNIATASEFVGPVSGLATSAVALKSSATTGLMQITGPAAGATRTMTIPDANFSAARTDAGQTFTGVQIMTSPNIVASVNDTNGNEVFGITATASAVNELTIANAATGNNPIISATGTDADIGVTITPKGTGNLVLTGGNLVVADGNGIDFSATSGTGTSELLGDYEEGQVANPLYVGGVQVTSGYTADAVTYTKVGNTVMMNFYVDYTSPAGTGPSGDVTIGLPFAPTNSAIAGMSLYMSVSAPSYVGAYISVASGVGTAAVTEANINTIYSLAQGERIIFRASTAYRAS